MFPFPVGRRLSDFVPSGLLRELGIPALPPASSSARTPSRRGCIHRERPNQRGGAPGSERSVRSGAIPRWRTERIRQKTKGFRRSAGMIETSLGPVTWDSGPCYPIGTAHWGLAGPNPDPGVHNWVVGYSGSLPPKAVQPPAAPGVDAGLSHARSPSPKKGAPSVHVGQYRCQTGIDVPFGAQHSRQIAER